MKKTILIILSLISSTYFYSQKASDVLENGIKAKSNDLMIIKYNSASKLLEYSLSSSFNDATKPINFKPLDNETLILNPSNSINVYAFPVNPLNFNFTNKIEFINDPIDAEAAKVQLGIINLFTKIQPAQSLNIYNYIRAMANNTTVLSETNVCTKALNNSRDSINEVIELLKNDHKDEIVKIFKNLKGLNFSEKTVTISDLSSIEKELTKIKTSFSTTLEKITKIEDDIKKLECDLDQDKFNKLVIELALKDIKKALNGQYKRYENLYSVFEIVDKASKEYASGGGVDGLRWCKLLKNVETKSGKIAILTININESGAELSEDNEIIKSTTKEVVTTVIKFRKFQRFIPEISAGTAYTFFKYKEYGTSTNDLGEQIVSVASENNITNLNVTSMLNLTYYIENTSVHPFWQIGVGANSEIPTLLTGFGLRSVFGSNRICISGGIAMTWIKELQNLKLGDNVDGTTTIENDLKPTFSWPPKPYIGIQYNF